MKKHILILLTVIFLLPSSTAFCAKLACDCSLPGDAVTGAQLQFDDGAWINVPVYLTCVGTTETVTCVSPAQTICYDLAALPGGQHTVKGRFLNIWGQSNDSVPLPFTKGIPSTSPLLRLK